jgi:hypothetical protein
MLILLSLLAMAQEIIEVHAGSVISSPGMVPYITDTYSYLLPEPMYDVALTKAQKLGVCQSALDDTLKIVTKVEAVSSALTECQHQMKIDSQWQTHYMESQAQLQSVKRQRNVAVIVAGSILLGGAGTIAVLYAP